MFFVFRPTSRAVERFIDESEGLPLSYAPVGIVGHEASSDRDLDEAVAVIGHGKRDFERARTALATWQHFNLGWVTLFPPDAPTDEGTNVAVLIRHFGFWSLNGCRVVYAAADRDDDARFGFAYGTLTNHAEAGEELFEISMDPRSEKVIYRVRATSWPNTMLTRIGYPIVRMLQARFRRDSIEAMKRATTPD